MEKIVGFDVSEPSCLPFTPAHTSYEIIWADLAPVSYYGEGCVATYRKGRGVGDVSGDFSACESETTVPVRGLSVILKGEGDSYELACWSDGEFSWSLSISPGVPFQEWSRSLPGAVR